MSRSRRATSVRFRRSSDLVVYWRENRLLVEAFKSGVLVPGSPLVLGALDFFSTWRTAHALARHLRLNDGPAVRRLVGSLVECGLLDTREGTRPSNGARSAAWEEWGIEARFFHHATRNVIYAEPDVAEARLEGKAAAQPPRRPRSRSRAVLDFDSLRQRCGWI